MTVADLLARLEQHHAAPLHLRLPTGEFVPDHFHVTEVGHVQKAFVDCGGVRRNTAACLIQVWTAADFDHRLPAGKFAKILRLADSIPVSRDLPVEIEYGAAVAAQYVLSDVEITSQGLILQLSGKATDCLARERCGLNAEPTQSGCCAAGALPLAEARPATAAVGCCG